jgi:hypothetical protein
MRHTSSFIYKVFAVTLLSIFLTTTAPSHAAPTCKNLFILTPVESQEIWSDIWNLISQSPQAAKAAQAVRLSANDFQTERELTTYKTAFGRSFTQHLTSLTALELWVDFGAGLALPQLSYRNQISADGSHKAASTLAIAFKRPKENSLSLRLKQEMHDPQKFSYKEGRYLEDIPDSEIGLYQLGTDFWGVLAYTTQLDVVLGKYLSLLERNRGRFYFMAMKYSIDEKDYHDSDFAHKALLSGEHAYSTFIITKDGRHLDLPDWLREIAGVELTDVSNPNVESSIKTFEIRKIKNEIHIPRLKLIRTNDGVPPGRIFQEI